VLSTEAVSVARPQALGTQTPGEICSGRFLGVGGLTLTRGSYSTGQRARRLGTAGYAPPPARRRLDVSRHRHSDRPTNELRRRRRRRRRRRIVYLSIYLSIYGSGRLIAPPPALVLVFCAVDAVS
jgi:hypothetical protein